MVTGHLREQNGYFQMILTWKDASGKRRSKSISTGLTVKGNKKRAEKMLMKARSEFNPDNLAVNKGMLFTDFLGKWLNDKVAEIPAEEYSSFAYYVKSNISPYFFCTQRKGHGNNRSGADCILRDRALAERHRQQSLAVNQPHDLHGAGLCRNHRLEVRQSGT